MEVRATSTGAQIGGTDMELIVYESVLQDRMVHTVFGVFEYMGADRQRVLNEVFDLQAEKSGESTLFRFIEEDRAVPSGPEPMHGLGQTRIAELWKGQYRGYAGNSYYDGDVVLVSGTAAYEGPQQLQLKAMAINHYLLHRYVRSVDGVGVELYITYGRELVGGLD